MKTNLNWLRNLTSYQKYSKRKLDERWNKHEKIFNKDIAKKDVKDMDWRELHYVANAFKKGRKYIKNPSEAPKDANIKRGPRGGYYYEAVSRKVPLDTPPDYKPGFEESDLDFPGLTSVENFLNDVPTFENLVVTVRGVEYYMVVEEWFPDCLESRGLGKTTESAIAKKYLKIMEKETGLKADAHGYLPHSDQAEYGLSYVMQKVKNGKKSEY